VSHRNSPPRLVGLGLIAGLLAVLTTGCDQPTAPPEPSSPPTPIGSMEQQPAETVEQKSTPSGSTKPDPADVIRTRIAIRDRQRAGAPDPTPTPRPRGEASIRPDGVIVAPNVGLMWTPDAVGGFSFDDAVRYCSSSTLGEFSDWRVTTIDELEKILWADVVLSIPPTALHLWTSTPAEERGHVTVDLSTDERSRLDAALAHVVCVRTIQ